MRAGLIAAGWLRTRVFSLSPRAWHALLAIAILLFSAAVALWRMGDVPLIVVAVMALIVAGVTLPTWRWIRLRQLRNSPAVVLARFRGTNPAYQEIATVHVREVERRLRRNPVLLEAVEIHLEHAPLSETHARRLMRHADGVVAVVSGSGLVVSDHARWEGWVLTLWPILTYRTLRHEETGEQKVVDEQISVEEFERTELPVDAETPTVSLTSEIFSAAHAAAVEATLLVCARAWNSDEQLSGRLLQEASLLAEHMPLEIRATYETSRIAEEHEDDVRAAAGELESVGDSTVPHHFLFNACFTVMAQYPEFFEHSDRLRVLRKALRLAPDDVPANTNAGLTLFWMGRHDDARHHLGRAYDLRRGNEPSNLEPMLVAHLFRVGGSTDDWDRWLKRFDALDVRHRPGVLAQIEVFADELVQGRPPAHFGSGVGTTRDAHE